MEPKIPHARDSLGGKNSPGRRSGARSSRALSTIFKKLRRLDHQITEADKQLVYRAIMVKGYAERIQAKRNKLDAERKRVRLLRKGYAVATPSKP